METHALTLFYDGLCPLCSREIAHYRHRTKDDPSIKYVDIAAPGFDAAGYGLDSTRIHKVMHVKVGDEFHTGLDAFIAVWRRVRGFGWLSRLACCPGVYQLLWLGYGVFAAVRPLLPRRQAECAAGTCQR